MSTRILTSPMVSPCNKSVFRQFTLIEVIIAVSLLVTVIGVLFLGTSTIMRSWEQSQTEANQLQELLLVDRTLDSLLTNIIPFTWPNKDFQRPPQTLHGDNEQLYFNYIHSFNRLEDGAIRSCCLLLEKNELVAYYCERPPFPENLNSEYLKRSVLARNVGSISFFYLDRDENANIDFVNEWEDQDYLPLAILLHIEWENGAAYNWLRRTAGTAYLERWGKWEQRNRE